MEYLRKTLEARKTKENFSFENWLGFVDSIYLTLGFPYRVVEQTGADCWRDFYESGYSAYDAVIEDFHCGA